MELRRRSLTSALTLGKSQKKILSKYKKSGSSFLLSNQAKSNFSPWQVTALGVIFSVKYGRWGYHKDTDDYRKAVETLLVGQQFWSQRSRLSSFHCLVELKLGRSVFWEFWLKNKWRVSWVLPIEGRTLFYALPRKEKGESYDTSRRSSRTAPNQPIADLCRRDSKSDWLLIEKGDTNANK